MYLHKVFEGTLCLYVMYVLLYYALQADIAVLPCF